MVNWALFFAFLSIARQTKAKFLGATYAAKL